MGSSDGIPDGSHGAGAVCPACSIVANEEEQVNGLIQRQGLLEPLLLDHVGGRDDLRGVRVAYKVTVRP